MWSRSAFRGPLRDLVVHQPNPGDHLEADVASGKKKPSVFTRQAELCAYLDDARGAAPREVALELGVSRQEALRLLKGLRSHGLADFPGLTSGGRWTLTSDGQAWLNEAFQQARRFLDISE